MIEALSFCVISSRNPAGSAKRCVESILRQGVPDYEILVFSQTKEVPDIKYFYNARWVEEGALNKVRNHLLSQASKEFAVLVDYDVEFSSTWYENIRWGTFFDIIGSRLLTPDGKRAVDWAYQFKLGSGVRPISLQYDEWTPKGYVSGSLMVVRRSVLDSVRFREDLFLGQHGDADFCVRTSETGFRVGVLPKAVATLRSKYGPDEARDSIIIEKALKAAKAFRGFLTERDRAYRKKKERLSEFVALVKRKIKSMWGCG